MLLPPVSNLHLQTFAASAGLRHRSAARLCCKGRLGQDHRSRKLTKATGPYQTKRVAEGLAEKMLRPLNDGELVAESTMTLNRFIETVYLPYAERQKRRSTFLGYRNIWKRYIKPDG